MIFVKSNGRKKQNKFIINNLEFVLFIVMIHKETELWKYTNVRVINRLVIFFFNLVKLAF